MPGQDGRLVLEHAGGADAGGGDVGGANGGSTEQHDAGLALLVQLAHAPDVAEAPERPQPTEPPRQSSQPARRVGFALASKYQLLRSPWPLPVILFAQAVLSARLFWSNTAFQDESLYLRAGHLELAHLIHGAAVPPFQTYFSGAPVLYPPIAALADSAGGLVGARLLSLAFMLTTTVLLYFTAKRLFSRGPALAAAALFATFGMADQLGAFATYDAMALCLLALAAWLVVRVRGGSRAADRAAPDRGRDQPRSGRCDQVRDRAVESGRHRARDPGYANRAQAETVPERNPAR
jgi:hypothetical protein